MVLFRPEEAPGVHEMGICSRSVNSVERMNRLC